MEVDRVLDVTVERKLTAKDWEETFRRWASPPSDSEEAKCERAERMIRDAVFADAWLNDRVARVFAKGSYANNTNARLESDVDIGVEAKCFFYESDPAGYPNFDAGT